MTPAHSLPSPATIVHQTRDRLRLRVPSRRGNHRWFAQLKHALNAIPAVEEALCNPRTASILLTFAEGDADLVLKALAELGQLAAPPTPPSAKGIAPPSNDTQPAWPGPGELRTLVKLLVAGLLVREVWNGRWLVPGVVVLWLGGETLRRQLGWPIGEKRPRSGGL